MTLVIPAGFYEMSIIHTQINTLRSGVCTIGFEYTGADFFADSSDVEVAWGARVMPLITANWRYSGATWKVAAGTVKTNSLSVIGGNGGAPMTPQVAYLVRKLTTSPGRKNRGRMYLPGVTEVEVDGQGAVSAAISGDLTAALALWLSDAAAAGFTPVILHNDVTTPTAIEGLVVEQLVATQRRRLR